MKYRTLRLTPTVLSLLYVAVVAIVVVVVMVVVAGVFCKNDEHLCGVSLDEEQEEDGIKFNFLFLHRAQLSVAESRTLSIHRWTSPARAHKMQHIMVLSRYSILYSFAIAAAAKVLMNNPQDNVAHIVAHISI